MTFNAMDVLEGRFEYYIEAATDQDIDYESRQAFALEFFATTILEVGAVQRALNSLGVEQGEDGYEDAVSDVVTRMTFAKVAELRQVLHLGGSDDT